MKDRQRDITVDIAKGVGIIAIVVGHSSWNVSILNHTIPIGPFVYLWHLAIFFFCSGYLYKETEEGIISYIVKRIKTLYIPFVKYSMIYLLFRYIFVWCKMVDGPQYGIGELVIRITNVLTFNGIGELLAAFWFLPVMFFTMCIFNVMFVFSKRFSQKAAGIFRIIFSVLCGIVGVYAMENQYGLVYNMQVVYLMIPIVYLGFCFKKFGVHLNMYKNIFIFVSSFLILCWVLSLGIGIVELSKYMIINRYAFYPVTLVGIIFCWSLSKVLEETKHVSKAIAYLGNISFDIMALHFVGIKMVDFLYGSITGNTENMSNFPYAFSNLYLVYYVMGLVLPVIIKKCLNKICNRGGEN